MTSNKEKTSGCCSVRRRMRIEISCEPRVFDSSSLSPECVITGPAPPRDGQRLSLKSTSPSFLPLLLKSSTVASNQIHPPRQPHSSRIRKTSPSSSYMVEGKNIDMPGASSRMRRGGRPRTASKHSPDFAVLPPHSLPMASKTHWSPPARSKAQMMTAWDLRPASLYRAISAPEEGSTTRAHAPSTLPKEPLYEFTVMTMRWMLRGTSRNLIVIRSSSPAPSPVLLSPLCFTPGAWVSLCQTTSLTAR
mmetsp:Transcript_134404/g.374600  ORF Transcript_134404/g.374600 Transcript_134404/m.374600 type:complete len:248 (-) Transcript_134404:653-1396(-)